MLRRCPDGDLLDAVRELLVADGVPLHRAIAFELRLRERLGGRRFYVRRAIVPAIGDWAKAAPWTFAFGPFFASVLLYSQAATTRALMPLGMAFGIPPQFLIAMFPSVSGYCFIPSYGSLIGAINFDLSGTTRIGKYALNHWFMIPAIIATSTAVIFGLAIARMLFGG